MSSSGHAHHSDEYKTSGETLKNPGYVMEHVWACDNCGSDAGMNVFTEYCPECQHLRCSTCPVESVKRRGHDSGIAQSWPDLASRRMAESSVQPAEYVNFCSFPSPIKI
jgi:hypothetical protein